MKKLKWLLYAFIVVLPSQLAAQNQDQKLYRIYFDQYAQIRNLESTGVNIYNLCPDVYIDILAKPEQADRISQEGLQIEFLANDFLELARVRHFKSAPEFHDYQETMDELERIAETYPDITSLSQIGESVLGRKIACLKISDNPDEDEDEVPILICGAHHGNEVLSVEAPLYQINYLVEHYATDAEVAEWVNNYEIWFVPLVNPDGREAVRRTNENGVDLNRNYGFQHTAEGNHGTPFSEPETQAIRDLVAEFPPVMSITYHTSGRYVLYPWTHAYEGCPDSSAFIYQGGLLAESIVFPDGGGTDHYTLRQGGRWYFTAGEYCDYLYAVHGTLAYTIEMYTRQNPEGSVIPEVVERNLEGFKFFMNQARKAGVTGIITDKVTGDPVVAEISIPALDDQGKLEPRLSDSVFGRYYRYLAPGNYQFLFRAEGYRDYYVDVIIQADQMTQLDVEMESGPLFTLQPVAYFDGQQLETQGNQDGHFNLGEVMGVQLTLVNENNMEAQDVYARIKTSSPYVQILKDSLFFGASAGLDTLNTQENILITLSDDCPDQEELFFKVEISDGEGIGWISSFTTKAFTPLLEFSRVNVLDGDFNDNGILERGERVDLELLITNVGHQILDGLEFVLLSGNQEYTIHQQPNYDGEIEPSSSVLLNANVELDADADPVRIGKFEVQISSAVGYAINLDFRLQNFVGLYEDFEDQGDRWTHASYQTSSNHHDDWQLGEPQGLAGDPQGAYSGNNSWGTDLGYELYNGESWNGAYQNNVYNYLKSPVIDCSELSGTGLRYWRCLNTLSNDIGRILVNDSLVWQSPRRGFSDGDWVMHDIDISAIADGNSQVTIVYEMESDNLSYVGGWNIDDVIIANGLYETNSGDGMDADRDLKPQIYPNPFSSNCQIGFSLAAAQSIKITIVDINGRVIRSLADQQFPSGGSQLVWDGCNESGQDVRAGLYIVRMRYPNKLQLVPLIKLEY